MNLALRRQGQCGAAGARWRSRSRPAPRPSSCTRTGARRRRRSTAASSVGDDFDVQCMIHTDTLNESGFVEDTIAAFKGRTIHAFHTEGAGGGHAPDIIKVCGPAERPAVLDQSDAALHREHARGASRHAHGLPPSRPVDPRGHRLRREPHPQGDDRRRGHPARHRRVLDHRLGQPGDGPRRRGDHPHLADRPQDERAARPPAARRRARTTISASSATSPSRRSTRRSRMASTPMSARSRSASSPISSSGRRPSSASSRTWCSSSARSPPPPMGDPNASIPTPQPVHYRPMFGAFGRR